MATKNAKVEKTMKDVSKKAKEAGGKAAAATKVAGEKAIKATKEAGEKAASKAKDAGQVAKTAAKTAADKAKEGIMAFGNTVASKSKEIMETAKLNTQKSQKQKEMDEAYRQLGEMAYAKGRLRGDMAETGKKIKDLYGELQQIEVAINCAQSTKECKKCGNKCSVGDNYCSQCGGKL